jgi:DHA1 family multidrug resistance protein-like MFS transporter
LQTGIFLGGSLGPVIGGGVADLFGYRATFWVTSLCLTMAGLAVHFFVTEGDSSSERLAGSKDSHPWDGLLVVLRFAPLRIVFVVRMFSRLASRIAAPMLPLFVQELVKSTTRLATITGTISGAGAFAAAAGASLLGRASDRIGHRKLLLLCITGLVLIYLPQAIVTNPLQLGLLQVGAGFLMAGVIACVAALLATRVPEGRQGAVYGVNTMIVAGANAFAPILGAGVAIWWGLRSVFIVSAVLFLLSGLVTLWLLPAAKPVEAGSRHANP